MGYLDVRKGGRVHRGRYYTIAGSYCLAYHMRQQGCIPVEQDVKALPAPGLQHGLCEGVGGARGDRGIVCVCVCV